MYLAPAECQQCDGKGFVWVKRPMYAQDIRDPMPTLIGYEEKNSICLNCRGTGKVMVAMPGHLIKDMGGSK